MLEERLAHGPAQISSSVNRVRCQSQRAAELAELAEDAGLVLVLPLPDALDQLLAAEVVAGLLLLLARRAVPTTACVAMPAWSVPGIHRAL